MLNSFNPVLSDGTSQNNFHVRISRLIADKRTTQIECPIDYHN